MDGYESAAQFDHRRLDAYTAAVALDALVVALAWRTPRGRAWLGDQAQRASASAHPTRPGRSPEGVSPSHGIACTRHRVVGRVRPIAVYSTG